MCEGGNRAVTLATTVVLCKETRDLREDVKSYNRLINNRPVEAGLILNRIVKEKRRLRELPWDEEEVMIYHIEKRRR